MIVSSTHIEFLFIDFIVDLRFSSCTSSCLWLPSSCDPVSTNVRPLKRPTIVMALPRQLTSATPATYWRPAIIRIMWVSWGITLLLIWTVPDAILLVIRSVSDVLRAQSRFVKFVGGEAAGRTPFTFCKPTLGPKYVRHRPYNEFVTLTTFI